MNIHRSMGGGAGLFTGFTRLCKGLAAILVIGYAISQVFPSTVEYLALIPGKYTPLYGFHGVLSGFLVGVKQIMPDQEIIALFVLKMRAKWLPSLLVLVSIIVSFLATESTSYLPFIVFGTYGSWLYLRYLQRKPETNLKGDPSDDFAFSTFFPAFMRPIVDAFALICQKIFCGTTQTSSGGGDGYDFGGMSLPGSDPAEASRRR